jgi:hypothetical protein
MSKKSLGTNGKHRANSPTAIRMLRLQKRRKEALEYRLQGRSFRAIAQTMRINVATAHDYVVRCLHDVVPAELPKQVLAQELLRLDEYQASLHQRAVKGEVAAIEACLKIQNQRAKLCGLYPQSGAPLTVNNNNMIGTDARTVGIQVSFVAPRLETRADGSIWKGDQMMQGPDLDPPKPAKLLPASDSFGPNILRFDRC